MLTMHFARSVSEEIARTAGLPGLPSAQLHVNEVPLCELSLKELGVESSNLKK